MANAEETRGAAIGDAISRHLDAMQRHVDHDQAKNATAQRLREEVYRQNSEYLKGRS